MKALTLWRPWDRAILFGGKDCENRGRPCPIGVLGTTIALHGGKTYQVGSWAYPGGWVPPVERESPTGIVGVARVLGCLDRRDPRQPRLLVAPDLDRDEHARVVERLKTLHMDPWWSGPCGILLGERIAIAPVPCNGAMGWWNVPAEVADVVDARAAEAWASAGVAT